MPIIIENLTHTYMPGSVTQFTALYDINLTVEDGEFFGIIGHTGSGKSTLIQQLNGLIQPTSGRGIVERKKTASRRKKTCRHGFSVSGLSAF